MSPLHYPWGCRLQFRILCVTRLCERAAKVPACLSLRSARLLCCSGEIEPSLEVVLLERAEHPAVIFPFALYCHLLPRVRIKQKERKRIKKDKKRESWHQWDWFGVRVKRLSHTWLCDPLLSSCERQAHALWCVLPLDTLSGKFSLFSSPFI